MEITKRDYKYEHSFGNHLQLSATILNDDDYNIKILGNIYNGIANCFACVFADNL